MTALAGKYTTLAILLCQMQNNVDDLESTNSLHNWKSDKTTTKNHSQDLIGLLQTLYHQFGTTKKSLSTDQISGDASPDEIFSVFLKHADNLINAIGVGLHLRGNRPARLSDDFYDRRDQIDIMQKAVSNPLRKLCNSVVHGVI